MSVGYATIYGDMAGGYNPLKDAYKTTVFALAEWRNAPVPRLSRNPVASVLPARVVAKPPSAELRPDQQDEASLPPYAGLDRMLHMLVAGDARVDALVARSVFSRDPPASLHPPPSTSRNQPPPPPP